ncbi:MAG: Anti-FecI sigma factor, FecR [Mucilaginibacter sp.]|nr:Anti-FecI sigma factor, FecR [Mucilaginibacter sp.]
MDVNKYSSYTFKEFLEDDDFITWVLNPTDEQNIFWNNFSERFPDKKEDISRASSVILTYRKQDTFFNEDRITDVWKRIEVKVGPAAKQAKVFRLPQFLRVAAAILLIALAAIIYKYNQPKNFQTAFGEIKTIVMPDGTIVLLNGNSTLTYEHGWGKNSREVWLKGEGFFNVTHLNQDPAHIKKSERFVVHCNDLNIEVLGTTFNVKNRHDKVNVGLVTGKIRLTTNLVKKILSPGDYAEYAAKNISLKSKLTHPEKLMSWSKRQFIFSNVKLGDILRTLEDSYGYQIKYTNPSSRDLEIEGEISVTGVKELLETISTSLHVNVYQNDHQITIN